MTDLQTLIRLLAKQAVRDHLQAQQAAPCGQRPERSNRPVQNPARSR